MSRADSSPTPSSASSSSSSSASSSTSTYNVNASSSSRDNHLATARTECLPVPAGEQNNDDDSEVDESDIFQLVYCSSSISPAMPRDDLIDILSVCRRNNAAAAISGLLMYKDGQFVQFLEGPEHRVRRIFTKINKDERHSGVYVLLEQKTNKRDFPQWSMAFRDLARSERLPPNRENISLDEKGELIKDENDAFNDIMVKNNIESTMFSNNMNYKIKSLVDLYHRLFMRN
ncbi:bluf domain protein [Phaffia rhodozyma]|uniref:Bluf domain protein n=1 Tax=Phaffia rhodozyma TaxID=264483 RepID=A0A0F7SY49_PHARH|nr:bluf domain protein [Phaffia rhodozyma]